MNEQNLNYKQLSSANCDEFTNFFRFEVGIVFYLLLVASLDWAGYLIYVFYFYLKQISKFKFRDYFLVLTQVIASL